MAKRGKIKKKDRKEKNEIERPIRYRKYQQFFLIVCEDESTEPYYFGNFESLFPAHTLFLKTVGTGKDPLGVVQQSILERQKLYDLSRKEIDFVWVVFDKDDADENDAKIERFEKAFNIAKDETIEIAYSNEVFELWLLLHLIDIDPQIPLPRKQVYEKLERAIKSNSRYKEFKYIHGHKEIVEIVFKIGDEKKAMEQAADLLSYNNGKSPIESNPSTKVHILVKELRDWIQYYNWEPEN